MKKSFPLGFTLLFLLIARVVSGAELVWVDDALPAGAITDVSGGDAWTWVAAAPTPFSGTAAHQSNIAKNRLHEHAFSNATSTLPVAVGDVLFAYVFLDPANPPTEIMVSWNDGGSWEHRAYYGANRISIGTNNTASRYPMGALPATGQWVRLEIPASKVGLEGKTISGMRFSLYSGRATWDRAGNVTTTTPSSTTTTTTTNTTTTATPASSDSIWFDDALPTGSGTGSTGGDAWTWLTASPAPFSGTGAHQSNLAAGLHEHYFNWATGTQSVLSGDKLVAYVFIDAANPPSELMLSWTDGSSWEHRAYWGADLISYGNAGTAGRYYMGALPAAGQWVRLEVPASVVALEGVTLQGMAFSLYNGRATWDRSGTAPATATSTTTTSTAATTQVVAPTFNPVGGSYTSAQSVTIASSTTGSSIRYTLDGSTPTATTGAIYAGPVSIGNGSTTLKAIAYASGATDSTVTSATYSITTATTSTTTASTGTSSTTTIAAENAALKLPNVGDSTLTILGPTLLELERINTKLPDPATVDSWNLVDASNNFVAPPLSSFVVTVNGQPVSVTGVGFKRRVRSAPLAVRDLRIDNFIYLKLASPIAEGQAVTVTNPDGTLWEATMKFAATADPLRYSPAIHVNQEGYVPALPKKAMLGYYLGNLGEMSVPASTGFKLVSAATGATVFQGTLTARQDVGYAYSPLPYQQVLVADFSAYTAPGEYQLVVPGLGASLPFLIDEGIAMGFLRTYALGIYHQRCGASNVLPYTRFVHDACHIAASEVPSPQSSYAFTWTTIAGKSGGNTTQTAPQLRDEASQLYPFVNKGTVDVAGGHHDAGDYSKYTINSAQLVHELMFAVDGIPGVAGLDNLGLPESGDGISDLMQEAKWEADYIAKLQDADGGFYFIVYPKTREYENGVLPDHGDSQVVWPKNTSATAAAVAALAQCASSPAFKQAYPAVAAAYLSKAKLGWQFLTNAINKYGKAGSYQKVTFYGDRWNHDDELAWAACELFLATGDSAYQQKLMEWFPNPSDSNTFLWGWWRMSESWGNAIRSYAFAARSGRLAATQLTGTYLAACETQIKAAADDALTWSNQNAYATSFPYETKRVQSAGWYFSLNQAADMATAYPLNPRPEYTDALVGNMNYEGGTNPVNVAYLTGLGLKRQREVVNQYAFADRRVLAPAGIPLGNIQSSFDYLPNYGSSLGNELAKLTFPADGGSSVYPFYDRWADTWNVTTEFITINQARAIRALAPLALQTSAKSTAWTSTTAVKIVAPTTTVALGTPVTLSLSTTGLDLTNSRIVWEARDQQPDYGSSYTIAPKNNGDQWVEAEVTWPDGRRAFATGTFTANSPVITWVDDAMPAGASPVGNEAWSWTASSPAPSAGALAHQSTLAAGTHEHGFDNAASALIVSAGDKLFAYVYLDPTNIPGEIMLHWNDGTWEHRAYWGANVIGYGTNGTASRYNMGALPAAGQWVRLEVPASFVGLEGSAIKGMCFSCSGGRATWDAAGKASPTN